jgi:DNA-binding MarR family transcriptional regulator
MTTLTNRLEDAGLAVREPDPTDGRAVRVTITPAGAARILAYRESRAELIRVRVSQLSDDEQAALLAALPALRSFAGHPAPAKTNKQTNR